MNHPPVSNRISEPPPWLSGQEALRFLEMLLRIRIFEEKIVEVYGEQKMRSPVHLSIGQEAVATGVCIHLRENDYLFATHRGHGACLAKGMAPVDMYAEFYGRREGCSHGKGGSMHLVDPSKGILGTTAIVGGGIPLGVGTALASHLRKDDRVTVVFFGDGAVEEGSFHEGLNFAALKRLPVVFVCENNFYATNSPLSARQPNDRIAERASGYGIPGVAVDGNDVLQVYQAGGEAIMRARAGGGPTLLECRTYRWKGHVGPHTDFQGGFRPEEELASWMRHCPILLFQDLAIRSGLVSEERVKTMRIAIEEEMAAALNKAQSLPLPDRQELHHHVYFRKDEECPGQKS